MTLPSPLLARSTTFGFFPLTARSSRGVWGTLAGPRFVKVPFALDGLASCISRVPSGARNVCSLNALRCLFAFGSDTDPSDDAGLGLRLLLRIELAPGAVTAVENMAVFYLCQMLMRTGSGHE
jgi:hypothetical protein